MQSSYHALKPTPIAQPTAIVTTPNITISIVDRRVFAAPIPITRAFAIPKLMSQAIPMPMQIPTCWVSLFIPPAVTIQGMAGRMPNIMKEMKVERPFFHTATPSLTTRPSSYNIITFTIAFELVASKSATLAESAFEQPFSSQIQMISAFSFSTMFQTSQSYLSCSDLIYSCSVLADRYQPRPIESASPKTRAMTNVMILQAVVLEAIPEKMIIRELIVPSIPPQMADLISYPASRCIS